VDLNLYSIQWRLLTVNHLFNLFYDARAHEPLDVLHSSTSSSRSWSEAYDSEGGGPASGPIADKAGCHAAEAYQVYQAHQTRSQWLAPHLSAATVMTTAYWMFQVFSTFSSSVSAACQCVTEQVSGSSRGCQVCPRRVQRVQTGRGPRGWTSWSAWAVASVSGREQPRSSR
jgi:hypothetical protein